MNEPSKCDKCDIVKKEGVMIYMIKYLENISILCQKHYDEKKNELHTKHIDWTGVNLVA